MRSIRPNRLAFPTAILAALVMPSAVAGSQDIAIRPAAGGSALQIRGDDAAERVTLSLSGPDLVVKGFFDGPTPEQCTVVEDRRTIHCPLSAIDAVSIDMEGGRDAVAVSETLPVPVTARLGDGVDGFAGAGEADTCLGQAGDDVCTTGEGDDVCQGGAEEDHCVMGGGRDLCALGPQQDGCTGNAGPDTCEGGPGTDRCKGGEGNDLLVGGRGRDGEIGGRGRDRCDPSPGHDALHDCEVVLP